MSNATALQVRHEATPQPIPVAPAPQPPAAAALPQATASAPPKKTTLFTIIFGGIALLGVLMVLFAWRLPPFSLGAQTTDNAYVRGQVTVISPQVTGYVTGVPVQDYQSVKKGQVLATIDDRIYRQRLDQAIANLHGAEAALANSPQAVTAARNSVAQSQASIANAGAQLAKAQADAKRSERLFEAGALAQADLDAARAALQTAQSQVDQTRAQRDTAQTSVTTAVVSRGSLEAAVENARALVQLAEIDLENTKIVAPRDGRLGEVTARQGAQVATGTQLMALVPDRIWVVANMRETQMAKITVGQSATLKIDTLGGKELTGRVEQIAPATGSEFSVIRPDNATGNFTKVAQRVPVRIAIDPGQPLASRLSPGMSVVAQINTQ